MISAVNQSPAFGSICIARLEKGASEIPMDKVNNVASIIKKPLLKGEKGAKGNFLVIDGIAPYNQDGYKYLVLRDNGKDYNPLFNAIKKVFGENNAFRV